MPNILPIFAVRADRETGEWIGEAQPTGETMDEMEFLLTSPDDGTHRDTYEVDGETRLVLLTWCGDPRATLAALIAASGLSAAAFARLVLGRDERTVRRWQSGETDIPDSAVEWLGRATVTSNGKSVYITVAR